MWSGFILRIRSRMPAPSSWNTPTLSPRDSISKVGVSSKSMVCVSSSMPRCFSSASALAMTVSVFRPRKSNFTRPAFSASS